MNAKMLPERAGVEYRKLEGFDFYWVGSDGTVWSTARNRVSQKKVVIGAYGYELAMLSRDNRSYAKPVHRLVLETFVGDCPEGMECRHLDGCRTNNKLENLCWGTRKQNASDRVRHGTTRRGERHPMAKLSPDSVQKIRDEYAAGGISQSALGKKYGVSQTLVGLIARGKIWANDDRCRRNVNPLSFATPEVCQFVTHASMSLIDELSQKTGLEKDVVSQLIRKAIA